MIDLTRELLGGGAFGHLPDDEVSRLHWIILQGQQGDIQTPLLPLLSYWYRGDYYTSNVSPGLLQQCNEYLQRLGQPRIDAFGEEFYEA